MKICKYRMCLVKLLFCMLICIVIILANPAITLASIDNTNSFVKLAESVFAEKIKMVNAISDQETVGMALGSFSSIISNGEIKTDTFEWQARGEVWGPQLDSITHSGNFYDIFLISLDGNILYTTVREEDLGRNVNDTELNKQGIHTVFNAVVDSNVSVSYVEPYLPSNELYSTFVASPVRDLNGDVCGVFAVQIAFKTIIEAIYGEGTVFEVSHIEKFNREVVDSASQYFKVSIETSESIQMFMVGVSPGDGSNIGNGHDVGILSAEKPSKNGTRLCSKWIQFGVEDGMVEDMPVTEVYYHIWWKAWEGWAEFGVDTEGNYDQDMTISEPLSQTETVSQDHENGYMLSTGVLILDEEGVCLNTMAVKLKAFDNLPVIYSGPSQASFIIINPESDAILRSRDLDEDGLTDYQEMYETHTDPHETDTDGDDLSDSFELGSDPNLADTDRDGLEDRIDEHPLASSFDKINGTKHVTGVEIISGAYLLDGSIIVEDGAELTILDSNLQFTGGAKVQVITVREGGTLIIKRSSIILGSALDWFINVGRWLNWNEWDHISSYGNLIIEDSTIRCASILFVNSNDECSIEGSRFFDMFYAIRLKSTDAIIKNTVIDAPAGYGMFFTDCNPIVENSDISLPIGTALYCVSASPSISDCRIESLVEIALDSDSHPIFRNTIYHGDKIKMYDTESSIINYSEMSIIATNKPFPLAIVWAIAAICLLVSTAVWRIKALSAAIPFRFV